MRSIIQTSFLLATVSVLAGCNGSSGGGALPSDAPLAEASTDPIAPNICDSDLYDTLQGSYNGQIEYAPEQVFFDVLPDACLWEVSLSIETTPNELNYSCEVTAALSSELLSGDAVCSDLTTTGDVTGFQGVDPEAPQWPIVIDVRTPQNLEIGTVYPTGNTQNTGLFSYVFDGLGNLTFSSPSTSAGYSGTLVQFSDQPFQIDGFSEMVGLSNEAE